MFPLHSLEEFNSITTTLEEAVEFLKNQSSISIIFPAKLSSAIAASLIEAAFLDVGMAYHRKISTSDSIESSAPCIIIDPDEQNELRIERGCLILGINSMEFNIGHSGKRNLGVLEQVGMAGLLAGILAPEGERTKRLRPWILAGSWLRDSLDTAYDPQYMRLKDLLSEAGEIQCLPLPELTDCDLSQLPGISTSLLSRMRKRWHSMSLEQRSEAMSDLLLPVLENPDCATARIEELGWRRVVGTGWVLDLATMLKKSRDSWLPDPLSVSKAMDSLISTGLL
jgi:hypothetical protein